jgi:Domain of unknown function (DUF4062)
MPRHPPENPEPLLIDRAAAAELPLPENIQEWALDKRVFISSVMSELAAERLAVAASVRKEGLAAVMFEEFGGRDADPQDAYLAEVDTADIFIGILGRTYGRPLKTRFSATHTEYLHAEKASLRIAMWAADTNEREGQEHSFLDEVRTFHVVPPYRSVSDLEIQVGQRLRSIAAEDLAPWCKLGQIVFRASEVDDHGHEIFVTAKVKDDAVGRALEATRGGDGWGSTKGIRFTWAGRSKPVDVDKVRVTSTSARSRTFRLKLSVTDRRDRDFEYSLNGLSADDLTDTALRIVLFGEQNPLARQHMGFAVELDDPFQALRDNPVSEEIIRPLSELFVADVLVGSGRAERLVAFKLGIPVRQRRSLSLQWETPRRHVNDKTTIRELKGEVAI